MLSFVPQDVSDEIWDLIESISGGFPTYFCEKRDIELTSKTLKCGTCLEKVDYSDLSLWEAAFMMGIQ